MNADRWQQVSEWFHRITELSGEERARALIDLSKTTPEVEEDVLDLLAADDIVGAEDSLASGRLQSSALWDEFSSALDEGRKAKALALGPLRAGPFKVGRELGRGGMALVHLGERVDGDFRQIVAIKRLTGVDRKGLTERLLAERRILAELRHPNIAQLIDGGTDSSGRPYLALEYVDGMPIDEYCDERRAGIRERLELFLQACAAVQHAHSNLVVHRDLKPSNIMVDKLGQVKLLDFGIAKILDPARDDGLTLNEVRPLTPRYAAPEQFLGAPSTTATDVYGLGIVLYELLVGNLPYSVSGGDVDSYRQAVLEQVPSTPQGTLSTLFPRGADTTQLEALATHRGTSVRRLRRSLGGDLRALFAKVLHREPEKRYLSAGEFSQEIARYLKHRPLHARPSTASYRMSRYMRRNRWPVAAAIGIVLALSVGLLVALDQAKKARRQVVLTEVERERAVRMKDLLASIIVGTDPERNRQERLTSEEFLERGVSEVMSGLAEEPEFRASLLEEIAVIYRHLGNLGAASSSSDQAVAVYRTLADHQGQLARALYNQSLIELDRRDQDAVEVLLEEVLVLEEERFARPQKSGAIADRTAVALNLMGTVHLRRKNYDKATEYYDRALGLFLEQDPEPFVQISVLRSNVGYMLVNQKKFDEGRQVYQRVLAEQRERLGADHSFVGSTLSNLGRIEVEEGNYDAAVQLLRESLDIQIAVFGPDHPSQSVELAWLSVVERERGNSRSSLEWARRSMQSLELRAEDHPRVLAAKANVADRLVTLAEEQKGSEAQALVQEAGQLIGKILPLMEKRFGDHHRRTLRVQFAALRARRIKGEVDSALQGLILLVPRVGASLGEDHRLYLESSRSLDAWRG